MTKWQAAKFILVVHWIILSAILWYDSCARVSNMPRPPLSHSKEFVTE